MIISHIKLKNWKNFAEADVNCGKRVFLIGPNASGKSNFLDALRFLRDVTQNGLEKAVMERGGLKSVRYIEARQRPDITISVTLGGLWRYSLAFGSEPKKPYSPPRIVEEVVEKVESAAQWKTILRRPDRYDQKDPVRLLQTALQQVNANKEFRVIADFFSTIQYRHILPQLVREPKAFSPNPVINDPYGRDLVFTIWKMPNKNRQARLSQINKILKVAVPNFENLDVVDPDKNTGTPHFKVKYTHWRQHGAYQSESSFSDGTLRLLALLWSLLDTKGPLLLEEPELSLHEEIVARLPALFVQVEKDKKAAGRQVFITTHAQALLRDPGIGASEVLRLEPSGSGVRVLAATEEEFQYMGKTGLSAADIMLPKTRPDNIERIRLS